MRLKRGILLAALLVAMPVLASICLDPASTNYCKDVQTQPECPGGPLVSDPNPAECVTGCCYSDSGSFSPCIESGTYKGICDIESGIFASSCSLVPECTRGCCCWFDNVNRSAVTVKGFCDKKTSVRGFDTSVLDPTQCALMCGANSTIGGGGGEPACSDGIDNDGDLLVDLADPGCIDSFDDSEPDSNLPCGDGLDNDADGKRDTLDTCCIDYHDQPEDICDMDNCTDGLSGNRIPGNVPECNCRYSDVCSGGQYCCEFGCQDTACGSQSCNTGDSWLCHYDSTGCPFYKYCINGEWNDTCIKSPACDLKSEICTDGIDNNGNALIDCEDVTCSGKACDPAIPSSCADLGYVYGTETRCCFAGGARDCDGNTIKETCGECNCLQTMPAPSFSGQKPVQRNQSGIVIKWGLTCDVDGYIFKCVGSCTNTSSFEQIAGPFGLWQHEYIDTAVVPNAQHCYFIQADYKGITKNSNITCINSGDDQCLGVTGEFCAVDSFGKRVKRAKCTSNGTVQVIKDCATLSQKDSYVCIGPDGHGITECVHQSPCDQCGTPLNMYASLFSSFAVYNNPNTGNPENMECNRIPTCYYDYSDTTKDKFSKCIDVQSCFSYRSQSACDAQAQSSGSITNKCLPRNCDWQQIGSDLDTGICMETIQRYQDCSYCNQAENNKIFDNCDVQRCRLFGQCYPNRDGTCTDSTLITCHDYLTATDCTGGRNATVDVTYLNQERVSGTNFVTPSLDSAGIGLCKWTGSQVNPCMKDADGDNFRDYPPDDRWPPVTRMLTPLKVKALNISFSVSDVNPYGKKGSGFATLYVCKDEMASCYPRTIVGPGLWQDFGGGQGLHDIYFYAIDKASNLEVVKKATIEVDRTKPVIKITPTITLDTITFKDSRVIFTVEVSESATCIDSFEGFSAKQIQGHGNNWTAPYSGLSDGFYAYRVDCTDDVGNSDFAVYTLRIDADPRITDPRPKGPIDDNPVEVSVRTTRTGHCKFGPTVSDYASLMYDFDSPVMDGSLYVHKKNVSLTASDTYSYDVKCDFGSDDEIQFVYDILPPTTSVLDLMGNPFNFQGWYTGSDFEGKVFLSCNDTPVGGYGCDKTYYCVSDKTCVPTTLYDETQPIDYAVPDLGRELHLCYYSTEKSLPEGGGRRENTTCKKISIDLYEPVLTLKNGLGYYDNIAKVLTVYDRSITIDGSVLDPDAGQDMKNTVRIANSNGTNYSGIAANNDFRQRVNLSIGLNVITITATDRSGAAVQKTVYIYATVYGGQAIELTLPNKFGVTSTQVTDLEIKTVRDVECRFSTLESASWDSYNRMVTRPESAGDGTTVFYHTFKGFVVGLEEVEQEAFFKCSDGLETFSARFWITWDSSAPVIKEIILDRSNGKVPPTIVDNPPEAYITVVTDDKARCRFYEAGLAATFTSMTKFSDYDIQNLTTDNRQIFRNLKENTTYNYNFACENGAYPLSASKVVPFTFRFDTSAATGITFLQPQKKSSNATFSFVIRTSKEGSCSYGLTLNKMTNMVTNDSRTHISSPVTLSEGKYTYLFECQTTLYPVSDSYSFVIDLSPPSKAAIDDGAKSCYLSSLAATWKSEDNLSSVKTYNYSIGTKQGLADISPWKTVTSNRVNAQKLNLTDKATYYWSVISMNEVGLWSEASHSDGILVDILGCNITEPPKFEPIPNTTEHCQNELKDSDETDVDCGGITCFGCLAGKGCVANFDCESDNCGEEGICVEANCSDGIKNQGEEGVDCGGPCDAGCVLGAPCQTDADCPDGESCNDFGECAKPNCYDRKRNGEEEGVDCGGLCDPCTNAGCESDSDCSDDEVCFENECIEKAGKGGFPWIWLIIILAGLIILGGGGYYAYTQYLQKPSTAPQARKTHLSVMRPMPPPTMEKTPQEKYLDTLGTMMRRKRQDMKTQERAKILSGFDEPDKPAAKTAVSRPSLDKTKEAAKADESGKSPAVDAKQSPQKQPEKPGDKVADKQASKPQETKKLEQPKKLEPPASPDALSSLMDIAKKRKPDALKELSRMTKKKRKKAMMQGEMFTYILTIITIGFLLYFAVTWIAKLMDDQQNIEMIKFKSTLESGFDNIGYGDSETLELSVPAKVEKLCFVDTSVKLPYLTYDICKKGDPNYEPIICDSWQDNTSSVMFSPPIDSEIDIGTVTIDTSNRYLCFDTRQSHRVKVVITGLGWTVRVSR
jgi:hypothetical protein